METLTLYHGTQKQFAKPSVEQTVDGGLHLGTLEQAKMRAAGKNTQIAQLTVTIGKYRRCHDRGGDWGTRIKAAKNAGLDAIVYLNRYEGMTLNTIDRARAQGIDLDGLSDRRFRAFCPEAAYSYILLRDDLIADIHWLNIAEPEQQTARPDAPSV